MGEFVTGTFDHDGGRTVTVHVPDAEPQIVVFAADGQQLVRWGADPQLLELPPVLLVGVHGSADETGRLHEYSPAFDPTRFDAHERFFVDEVRTWVAARFGVSPGPQRTAVLGVSAGGEFALALGLRHPDVYGAVLCASPGGGYRPPSALPTALPSSYLVAGSDEPFFLANAKRWEAALRAAGARVTLAERAGGHGGPFWRQEFPLMLAWAFGRPRA